MAEKVSELREGQPTSIRPGQAIRIGRRLYMVCSGCHSVIWINKPLFGSVHMCGGGS